MPSVLGSPLKCNMPLLKASRVQNKANSPSWDSLLRKTGFWFALGSRRNGWHCLRRAQILSRMDLILVWQGRGAWLVCSLWQRVDLLAPAWLTSFLDSGISGAKGV